MVAVMLTLRRCVATAALAVALTVPTALAQGASRPPIKDCGDVATIDEDQFFIGAITAQGTACTNAREIARVVAKSPGCKRKGSCVRRGYTCLLAKAGEELTLVHCESANQTRFVRFVFGS
jgi:hypothetical protein